MKANFLRLVLGGAFAVLMCLPTVFAQNVTGSITGQITDPSGAILPGGKVVAHNIDTGVETTTTTNGAGSYRIDFLPIGHYEVMAEVSGFGAQKIPAFSLEVLQTATFNFKMQMGSTSSTVSVTAAAPILNTDNPTLDATFTANTISNLPLNGLDFSALTLYMPGSVNTNGTSGMASIERSTYYSDTPNVNGNRAQANNYTLDGIDMNETFNNLIAYSPAPEALEEVKVLTADSPADYGNVNGGGVVSVLKSGTNQFHGSVYGYTVDRHMNANSWTNNQAVPKIPINPFAQSQFGGSLGGPILHNKLFFFADYLGARQHTGGIGKAASVMTQAMRNGDFSVLLTGPNPIQLYDPANNFAPYANNQGVPIVNPVAKFLFANPKLYPLPNATPTDGIVANNYQAPSTSYVVNDQGDAKLEYNPGISDKITAFYSMSTAYDGSTAVLPVAFPGTKVFPTKILGSNWVHTFSPSLVNSARVGFTRIVWNWGLPQDTTGVFGKSGDAKVGINFPNQAYEGFTSQGITGGLSNLGNQATNNQSLTDNTYSYMDNLNWQHGLHYISMGVQAIRYQNNYPTSNNNGYLGTLSYNGVFSANPAAANGGGYGGADFVLDRVQEATATLSSINVGQRQWRTAGFVSDDYKILPTLTLNLGLRYEIDEPWVESNHKTGNIDLATGQVLYSGHVPTAAPLGSGVCSNDACYQTNYRQIMPHLGFSYQATGRFVIRGGYGANSFFESNSSNQRLTSITPFIQAVDVKVNSPAPGKVTTARTAEQGFTGGATQFGGSYNVYPQNIQPAYVQQWNLTAEYALSRTTSLQVGYVGEQGQHIEDYGNVNQDKVNGDPTSAPFYNNKYLGINAIDPTGSIYQLVNGQYLGGNLLITESRGMMNFNGLESILRQRLNHGLEFTLNYTYSKSMTNSLGNYALNVNGYSGAFQNYYNSKADYGVAGSDVTHNVSGTAVYALPVGHGQEFLPNSNRVLDEVVGGWKIAVAGVGYSGFPETISGGSNNSNGDGTERVNQYRKLKVKNRSLSNWFGTDPSAAPCTTPGFDDGKCAFGVAAVNAFGTSSNGSIRGPGYLNVDMSAFKDFRIYGEHSVGFRFDAFNAMNIVSYGNPDTTITDSGYGQIAQQGKIRSQERHLQFSARYSF